VVSVSLSAVAVPCALSVKRAFASNLTCICCLCSQSQSPHTQNSGKVELTYNPEDRPISTLGMRRPTDLDIGVYPNAVDKPYRHMFQKLRDISEILDARVDDIGDRIVKKHALLAPKPAKDDQDEVVPSLAHVALPNQEIVPVVARVCLDTQGEGKLNAASVVFEGSRETSNGERVDVNLAEMPDFSLFPGQAS
jgi:hypothetical protein